MVDGRDFCVVAVTGFQEHSRGPKLVFPEGQCSTPQAFFPKASSRSIPAFAHSTRAFLSSQHQSLSVVGRGQRDDVDRLTLLGEPEVFRCESGRESLLLTLTGAFPAQLGGAFTKDGPCAGPINGLAVDAKPDAHFPQDVHAFSGNDALARRPDVQQVVAAPAGHVHEPGEHLQR